MPAPRRSSDLTILVAAGVATVLLSILSFIAAPVESLPPVDGSSYAAHPRGARAAYLALKAAGYRVERSFEPLTELARIPSPAVVILADPGEEPSQLDVRALRRFVEQGGVVLAKVNPVLRSCQVLQPTRANRAGIRIRRCRWPS